MAKRKSCLFNISPDLEQKLVNIVLMSVFILSYLVHDYIKSYYHGKKNLDRTSTPGDPNISPGNLSENCPSKYRPFLTVSYLHQATTIKLGHN